MYLIFIFDIFIFDRVKFIENRNGAYFDMSVEKPLKKKVSITLDDNIVDKIQILADEDDRNFSQYINMVLRKHISLKDTSDAENYSKKHSSSSSV